MKPALGLFAASIAWACALTSGCSSDYVLGALPTADSGAGDGGVRTPVTDASGSLDFGGDGSTGDSGKGAPSDGNLVFIVRDFKLFNANDSTTNPDFENIPKTDAEGNPNSTYIGPWDDRGIVLADLGADGKPVYDVNTPKKITTHGKTSFDQWYRDVAGTNLHFEIPFSLTKNADGSYGYDSQVSGIALSPTEPAKQFFPIDDGGPYPSAFGNQTDPHNYSFTCEIHTIFTYNGGEYLHYRGDDDVWVFINGKRVIDLGGIHDPETADIQVDALGLTTSRDYNLDFFFAERHQRGSNVLFTTSLQLRAAPR